MIFPTLPNGYPTLAGDPPPCPPATAGSIAVPLILTGAIRILPMRRLGERTDDIAAPNLGDSERVVRLGAAADSNGGICTVGDDRAAPADDVGAPPIPPNCRAYCITFFT